MSYDWSMFAVRLDGALTELARGEQNVLALSDSRDAAWLVQYLCGQELDGVWSEVPANKYLPTQRRLSKEQNQLLLDDGWTKPGGSFWRPAHSPNWSCSHDAGTGYRKLADMSVRVLRDVMRIESPSVLTYDAFVSGSGEPITLGRLELTRAVRPGNA